MKSVVEKDFGVNVLDIASDETMENADTNPSGNRISEICGYQNRVSETEYIKPAANEPDISSFIPDARIRGLPQLPPIFLKHNNHYSHAGFFMETTITKLLGLPACYS